MNYYSISLILLIVLCGALPLARSGSITNWGIRALHQNNVYAKTITITFSVENGLPVDEYLRIVFPYSLHNGVTNNAPTGVSATYYLFDTLTGLYTKTTVWKTVILKRSTETANAYYIQFLDAAGKVIALKAEFVAGRKPVVLAHSVITLSLFRKFRNSATPRNSAGLRLGALNTHSEAPPMVVA